MTPQGWLAALDHELRARGVPSGDRVDVVAEAETAIAEAEEGPVALFGLPDAYADLVQQAIARPRRPSIGTGPVLLRAEGLTASHGGRVVVGPLDLAVHRGEIMALTGANGTGKSTLLATLAGLHPAQAGTCTVEGAIGYCPQDGGLARHLTADDHMALFGAAAGLTAAESRRRGRVLSEQLGWDPEPRQQVRQMSGGTAQKLRVVTAMLGDPPLLLLDEPYQGLDADSTRRFWDLLWSWSAQGRAAVVSAHTGDVWRCADRVLDLTGVRA